MGLGTKGMNLDGTRDQGNESGWDQGPNGKNWLGPGAIATPIQSHIDLGETLKMVEEAGKGPFLNYISHNL